MEYPIILEGRQQGVLKVGQEGLFTVFEAHCPRRGGLIRLSVYGEGREGYLGIMQPLNGGLYLKKKLSRSRLSAFPDRLEFAGESGQRLSVEKAGADRGESTGAAETPPSPKESRGGERCWQRQRDGSLVCREGESFILALPVRLRHNVEGVSVTEIEGQAYMLFRY